MEIKEFAKEVHELACKNGWWDEERSFGDLIALCHSEFSEALEEYRNGHKPDETHYSCKLRSWNAECTGICKGCKHSKMEGIPSELADVIIRVLDMAEHYGIDIEAALSEKHEYNKTRPYKHGGKVM